MSIIADKHFSKESENIDLINVNQYLEMLTEANKIRYENSEEAKRLFLISANGYISSARTVTDSTVSIVYFHFQIKSSYQGCTCSSGHLFYICLGWLLAPQSTFAPQIPQKKKNVISISIHLSQVSISMKFLEDAQV